jgi:ABC-2 type transport system permease protein
LILLHLFRRRLLSSKNRLRSLSLWEGTRDAAFVLVGLWMLAGLHYGFYRLLFYLKDIELIGALLIWKLTAMALLTTFGMVVLSSLIISLTSLFYASDLPWLLRCPAGIRTVFLDKSLETVFFSSWMIALALLPFILALGRVLGAGWGFYAVFCALTPPFLALAAVLGMTFTLLLLRIFPSSRTRDVVWVLSSLSVAGLYMLLRFSQPERLIRPDMLKLVAEYLAYLQAPTAPYAPSWWMTKALKAWVLGERGTFWGQAALLWGSALALYAGLLSLAGRFYAVAYSGAQESRRGRRESDIPETPEMRLARFFGGGARARTIAALFWKERLTFSRDVKQWSQLVLIGALLCVYLFSIARLPLDTPDLKSLVSFLNIGIAGFVLAALCLRFTFPSVSLEGRSWWVVRSSPITVESVMFQKLLFTLGPMLLIATAMVAASNHLLEADAFISRLTLGTIWVAMGALCVMGIGLGAVFPRFHVENIHQIESSAGGFVYMACALSYVGFLVACEAMPVRMHFFERFGRLQPWEPGILLLCAATFIVVNAVAYVVPWILGRRSLEKYEGD